MRIKYMYVSMLHTTLKQSKLKYSPENIAFNKSLRHGTDDMQITGGINIL